MQKMKNRKFFSGKNRVVKKQNNSKQFYEAENNDNVSFINARRNTRSFKEQNSSNFGNNAKRYAKHVNPNTHNNSNNNNNNYNKENKKQYYQQSKYRDHKNVKHGKFQNPDVTKYISTVNFKDWSQVMLAINEQFQNVDLQKLHAIDDKLLAEAIISNNKLIAEMALVAYSYRKLISKKHIFYHPNWKKFREKTIIDLKLASELSKKPDLTDFSNKIKEILADIENTDKLLGHFIHDIVFNARSKLASSAYAYGLSLSQATNLLSADKDTVMALIGQTKMSDEDSIITGKTLKEKVNILKEMTKQKMWLKNESCFWYRSFN